jgi:hypothetical protein
MAAWMPSAQDSHARSATENTMETLLTVWYIFAFGVLIWNSLLQNDHGLSARGSDRTSSLDYTVSPALLSEWEAHQSNLIIIDSRAKTDSGRDSERFQVH